MVALAIAAATTAPETANPLVAIWLPVFAAVGAIVTVLLAASRRPGEDSSRLYGDAMKMVAELRGALAAETAKRENLELRLVEAQADRHDLEQRIVKLYSRIEELEKLVGGRRADDGELST